MNIILTIIEISLPAIIVACTAYFTLKIAFEKDLKRQVLELKSAGKKVINPIRLQAYERIALFLERARPESLLLRVPSTNLTAIEYRTLLLANIRSEFEHNLSQQVYISGALWQATKNAKEEMFEIINLAAGKLNIEATGADLATRVLELYVTIQPSPVDKALDLLRKEVTELY